MNEQQKAYEKAIAKSEEAAARGDYVTANKLLNQAGALKPVYSGREEYNPVEQFIIGAGRGVTDLAQGAKQKFLMATDPEEAKEYTKEINEDIAIFEEDFEGLGAESLGRFVGKSAPALLSGGGAAGAVGLAALESFIEPTKKAEWGEVAKNVALGTAAGAAGAAVPAFVRGRIPTPKTKDAKAALDAAVEQGLPLNPRGIGNTPVERMLGKPSEQAAGSATPARKALTETREILESRADESIGNLSDSLTRQTEKFDEAIDKSYLDAYATAGNIKLKPQPFYDEIDNLIKKQTTEITDPATGGKVTVPKLGAKGAVADLQELKRLAPENGTPVEWHEHVSRIGSLKASWTKEGWDTKPLTEAYWASRKFLNETVKAVKPEAGGLLEESDKLFSEFTQMTKDASIMGLKHQEIMGRAASVKSVEDASQIIKSLDPTGRKDMISGIYNEVVDSAIKGHGDDIMSFGKASTALDKYSNIIEGMKSYLPEEAEALEGLSAFMRQMSKQAVEEPHILNTIAVTAMTAGTNQFIPKMLMRDAGIKSMLRKMAKGDSRQQAMYAREIAQRLSALAAQEAVSDRTRGRDSDRMTIEIRDGVQQ